MSSLFTVLSVLPTSPILTPFSLAKLIYNSKALPKVKVFAWFVANKDNTNDLLESRRPYKALGQDQCIMCLKSSKLVYHLFLHCPTIIQLWYILFSIANLKWVPLSGIVEKLGISFEGLATYLEGRFFTMLYKSPCIVKYSHILISFFVIVGMTPRPSPVFFSIINTSFVSNKKNIYSCEPKSDSFIHES